ncbi:hypothetical protein RAK27_11955 [Carnobacterium maltaromaticum]|uniref:Uncharacterized protein n=1 Tax=Carnobacterium maltaromaticum TaxID=2751 RepID=A0AAW9JUZ9_CARML|nr:hypothetical protein [Carnobacterium maltaromaticum]MDZ5759378.1 hypothetical protein [Carnobacterium maltaromaticum]
MKYFYKDDKGNYMRGNDGQRLILNDEEKSLIESVFKPSPFRYEVVVTSHMIKQVQRIVNTLAIEPVKQALRRTSGDIEKAARILIDYKKTI